MVRGNSLIPHLLLLIASRHLHVHWHSEIRPSGSTLDCEDCQLIQSNFERSLDSDEAVTGTDLEGPVEGITRDDDWSQLFFRHAC